MPSRKTKLRLSIFVVTGLLVVHDAFPVFADGRLLPGSEALLADPKLIAAIGSAAHASIMQIPDTSAKFNALADLTDALMRLNDPIGARAVLADARNTVAQSSSLAAVEILMNLLVRAGENDAALDLVKKYPTGKVQGLANMAVAYVETGDIPAALKTVEVIDAEWRSIAHRPAAEKPALGQASPPPAMMKQRSPWAQRSEGSLPEARAWRPPAAGHDFPLYGIAAALVAKGDLDDAVRLTTKMIASIETPALKILILGMIAEAQCKAGERSSSASTLAQIKAVLDDPTRTAPVGLAFRASQAFAICGDTAQAKVFIDALPAGQSREKGFSELVKALVKNGDVTAARIFADANGDNADDLVLIGMAEEKGDHAAAVATLRAARENAMRPTWRTGESTATRTSGRRLRSIGNWCFFRCHCDIVGARSQSSHELFNCCYRGRDKKGRQGESSSNGRRGTRRLQGRPGKRSAVD